MATRGYFPPGCSPSLPRFVQRPKEASDEGTPNLASSSPKRTQTSQPRSAAFYAFFFWPPPVCYFSEACAGRSHWRRALLEFGEPQTERYRTSSSSYWGSFFSFPFFFCCYNNVLGKKIQKKNKKEKESRRKCVELSLEDYGTWLLCRRS